MPTVTLRSAAPTVALELDADLWATLRWHARRAGWQPLGAGGASPLGAYDVDGALVTARDALALGQALGRVEICGWAEDEVQAALRLRWLASEGEFVVSVR